MLDKDCSHIQEESKREWIASESFLYLLDSLEYYYIENCVFYTIISPDHLKQTSCVVNSNNILYSKVFPIQDIGI